MLTKTLRRDFDVLILGSGLGGTFIATILSKLGWRVGVLDAGTHPRFAIGESTIPHTTMVISQLSQKFGIPEFEVIGRGSPHAIRKHIGSVCGIKRVFGFAHHEKGEAFDPRRSIAVGNVWRDENHLFRQDIDAWMVRVALKYGATVLQNTRIDDIQIDDDGVRLKTPKGEEFTGRYLIDGTGFGSVLGRKFGLKDGGPELRTHSRSIFTHMIDVKPFEEVAGCPLSVPWSKSTLHHVFDGGWLWVIPFNNNAQSVNPLVSVGLQLDLRQYPLDPSITPEEEFAQFVRENLPSAWRQFEEAQAVRPWVRTPRLQSATRTSVGYRFSLMSHASGFIDPLYSRGLINTVEVVDATVDALHQALQDDDFSVERFGGIDDVQNRMVDYNDKIVSGSYVAWRDWDTWNAWMRVWAIGTGGAESRLNSHVMVRDASPFERVEDYVFSPYEHPGYKPFFGEAFQLMRRFEENEASAAETSRHLFDMLANFDCRLELFKGSEPSTWALKQPDCRDLFFGTDELIARWERREPDPFLARAAASK